MSEPRPGALDDYAVYLLLQGGGARAAYQVGVYDALRELGKEPDWVIGISMGSLNAAVIAGNPPAVRQEKLRGFWDSIATPFDWTNLMKGPLGTYWKYVAAYTESAVGMFGHRNFYRMRAVPYYMAPPGTDAAVSYYTDAPLARNMKRWVDFGYLNDGDRDHPTALSLGVTDVCTGKLEFFHSDKETFGIDHIRACAALPPGSAAVQVGDGWYWDGGVGANEPLAALLGTPQDPRPKLLVVVDLWSAEGARPMTMNNVTWREYQITYQSKVSALLNSIEKEFNRASGRMGGDPDVNTAAAGPAVVMHLVYREAVDVEPFDAVDFSRNSIAERIATGHTDLMNAVEAVIAERREQVKTGLSMFTFDGTDRRLTDRLQPTPPPIPGSG